MFHSGSLHCVFKRLELFCFVLFTIVSFFISIVLIHIPISYGDYQLITEHAIFTQNWAKMLPIGILDIYVQSTATATVSKFVKTSNNGLVNICILMQCIVIQSHESSVKIQEVRNSDNSPVLKHTNL